MINKTELKIITYSKVNSLHLRNDTLKMEADKLIL